MGKKFRKDRLYRKDAKGTFYFGVGLVAAPRGADGPDGASWEH